LPIIIGTQGNDRRTGSDGPDLMDMNGGNDVAYGKGGNDQLLGNAGNDRLYGGNGNDILVGGAGADVMYGGNGFDRFNFDTRATAVDWIMDFQHDVDTIDLSDIDANSRVAGNQAVIWRGYQGFTGRAGEGRVFQSGDNTVLALDFNGDAKADMRIMFDNHPLIGINDLVL
jgi:serralysin